MIEETTAVSTMIRHFNVAAERVFDAFLEPSVMKKWFLTTEFTNKAVKNVPHVGGTWETVDHRDGTDYRAIGTYLEINHPNRLAFTLQMPQLSESIDKIIVEIKTLEQGCEMAFTQNIPVTYDAGWTSQNVERAVNEAKNGSERVWNTLLGRLKQIVEG
ncbi:SRPBCC family protein [Sporolactobacillus sp. KGMB 08714]|uniref:SRPBCC family protein n=1 Tax=Sporolactobacillus sp. KGMB 08714 TaxID=3064704 RepID=UPI002FBD5A9C